MPDAEHKAGQLAEARAKGGVVPVENDLPHLVGVAAAGDQHGGERARVLRRIAAHDVQPPGPHGAAGGLGVPPVPGEHRGEPFLAEHGEALPQPEEQVGSRCVGEHSGVRGVEQGLPRPVTPWQPRLARRFERLRADRVEAEPRGQHHALLRTPHGDIGTPFVVPVVNGSE